MLIQRLVIDTIRRLWMIYGVGFFGILGVAWLAGMAQADGVEVILPAHVFALAMALTWFIDFIPMTMLEQREIARLPMSRREFWIARWWLSTIIPTAVVGAILAIAATLIPALALDRGTVILATLYSFLYGGCFLVVTIVAPLKAASSNSVWEQTRLLLVVFGLLLGGAGWPFLFAKYLPQTLTELNGPMQNAVIAALGITVASYFYRPRIAPRAGRPQWKKPPPRREARAGLSDRLTALPSLYWKEARKALTLNGSMLVIAIIYWWLFESGPDVIGEVISFSSLADFFHAGGALLFADVSSRPREYFPIAVMLLVMGTSDLGLAGELRLLRTLPLSATHLAVALSSLSIVTTSMLWITFLAAHAVALSTAPASLRLNFFIAISGGLAASVAIRLALPGTPGFKLMGTAALAIPAFVAVSQITSHANAPLRAGMIAGGALAFAASVLINRWSIRNSSRVYKKQLLALPFTAGAPPERM